MPPTTLENWMGRLRGLHYIVRYEQHELRKDHSHSYPVPSEPLLQGGATLNGGPPLTRTALLKSSSNGTTR